jgi:hypothetical protein
MIELKRTMRGIYDTTSGLAIEEDPWSKTVGLFCGVESYAVKFRDLEHLADWLDTLSEMLAALRKVPPA